MADMVIAVDPGRDKCGIAAVSRDRGVLYKAVVPTAALAGKVAKLAHDYGAAAVVVGDRTTGSAAVKELSALIIDGRPLMIATVDEHRSTDEARRRYWQENPPRGLRRLIPTTMQVPPAPVDDYVAVILAERYFASSR
ncbi:Holliday junction resolvase RuvX [Sporolituus thermophilus]|uniref:RNase H-fold protein, predicted Holliday junction resolvase n=1 Tax=Sporolituus thermophilus DSM 23256 TaxID=1123285 RepID=A0A1G7NEW5_9FIRM|nr:Holliday junction resolvase RuvX [Sporolituus thermophilus]SDF72584.1 RNase H-fold protein, predicted Holliday junction resolvase [Sporolituus thermophilus DSM 23256]